MRYGTLNRVKGTVANIERFLTVPNSQLSRHEKPFSTRATPWMLRQ